MRNVINDIKLKKQGVFFTITISRAGGMLTADGFLQSFNAARSKNRLWGYLISFYKRFSSFVT